MSAPTRGYGALEGFLAVQRCRMADKLLPAGLKSGRILDIGCSAHPLYLMNTDFSERYGLDKLIQQSHIDSYKAQNIILNNRDVEAEGRIPFEEAFFEAVIMLAVFEHIEPEKLVGLLGEVHRILKPGGMFVMTTPARWTNWLLKLFALLHLVSPDEINEHKDQYNIPGITAILEQAGFARADIGCGYFELGMNIWATGRK
ncbi:MAG: class I SAM-dependent methyltransferase [Candidatus Glassbacteria bacterium]